MAISATASLIRFSNLSMAKIKFSHSESLVTSGSFSIGDGDAAAVICCGKSMGDIGVPSGGSGGGGVPVGGGVCSCETGKEVMLPLRWDAEGDVEK